MATRRQITEEAISSLHTATTQLQLTTASHNATIAELLRTTASTNASVNSIQSSLRDILLQLAHLHKTHDRSCPSDHISLRSPSFSLHAPLQSLSPAPVPLQNRKTADKLGLLPRPEPLQTRQTDETHTQSLLPITNGFRQSLPFQPPILFTLTCPPPPRHPLTSPNLGFGFNCAAKFSSPSQAHGFTNLPENPPPSPPRTPPFPLPPPFLFELRLPSFPISPSHFLLLHCAENWCQTSPFSLLGMTLQPHPLFPNRHPSLLSHHHALLLPSNSHLFLSLFHPICFCCF